MDWKNLYLTYDGRVRRSVIWKYWILPIIVLNIVFSYIDNALGLYAFGATGVLSLVLALATLYPGICLSIKRVHDRGRSGWFILLAFVPILNLWYMVEVLFLAGTTGPNEYGADPKAA